MFMRTCMFIYIYIINYIETPYFIQVQNNIGLWFKANANEESINITVNRS
jgi:hypothetical protein